MQKQCEIVQAGRPGRPILPELYKDIVSIKNEK